MKNRLILIIFALGTFMVILGALFKIMHWPSANILLLMGMSSQLVAGMIAIWKILTHKKFQGFLNS